MKYVTRRFKVYCYEFVRLEGNAVVDKQLAERLEPLSYRGVRELTETGGALAGMVLARQYAVLRTYRLNQDDFVKYAQELKEEDVNNV